MSGQSCPQGPVLLVSDWVCAVSKKYDSEQDIWESAARCGCSTVQKDSEMEH